MEKAIRANEYNDINSITWEQVICESYTPNYTVPPKKMNQVIVTGTIENMDDTSMKTTKKRSNDEVEDSNVPIPVYKKKRRNNA